MMLEDRKTAARWPGLVAAAIAILANAWILGLDFSSDDFLLLTRVPKRFVPEPWIGVDDCSGAPLWYHEMVFAVPDRYLFRPAAWALWWGLARIGGPLVSAPLFHGASLLIHGIATWLVFALLRRMTDPLAAGCAALAFGLAPGSLQAVTSIAATGDTLAVPFLVLSALFLRRGRAHGAMASDVFAGLAFTLAIASKESAACFGPAVLLAGLAVPRSERPGGPSPLWRIALAFAAPFAVLLLLRHSYTGKWGPPSSAFSIPWASGRAELGFLGQTLAPWEAGKTGPLAVRGMEVLGLKDVRLGARVLGAAITLLPALAAALARPHRILPRLAAIIVALAIGLIPISRYLLGGGDGPVANGVGRAAYPVSMLVAAAIAFGLHAIAAWPRRVRIALMVPLLLWQADFLVHVAGVERSASDATRLRRSSLAEIAARSPPDTWFVTFEKPDSAERYGPTFNGYFIEDAFQPPFVEKRIRVTWMPRPPSWGGFDIPRCVRDYPGTVELLELDERGAWVDRGLALSRIRNEPPSIDVRSPRRWQAFDRRMPAIEWTPPADAKQSVVELRMKTSGLARESQVEIRTGAARVNFDPGLFLTYEGRPVLWSEAQAVIDELAQRQPQPTIQVDFRITATNGDGRTVGVSDWRTIYLTPKDT